MKRFILKLCLLIVTSLSIMLLFSYTYDSIRYKEKACYSEDKFSNVPYNIQVSNLGSSHGLYGFDYKNHNDQYTTFNFALSSQTLSYDYLILQQYESHLANNGTMFIVISNFSFGLDEEAEPSFQSKNKRYYTFLESKYIKQYDWKQELKTKYFNLFFTDAKDVISNIKKAKEKGQDTYQLGGEDFDYSKDALAAYKRHIHVDENKDLIILNNEVDALYGIIEICKKHNINPILITTPYRSEYNNEFNDKFYKQFHDIIKKVCDDTGVTYHDYSHDYRFINSNKLNRNADHLTPEGAIRFTDILFNDFKL